MTQKVYHVSNPIAFLAESWPLPPHSLVFWSHQQAGGVLLFAGLHYISNQPGRIVFSLPGLQAGDVISVVSFQTEGEKKLADRLAPISQLVWVGGEIKTKSAKKI